MSVNVRRVTRHASIPRDAVEHTSTDLLSLPPSELAQHVPDPEDRKAIGWLRVLSRARTAARLHPDESEETITVPVARSMTSELRDAAPRPAPRPTPRTDHRSIAVLRRPDQPTSIDHADDEPPVDIAPLTRNLTQELQKGGHQ